MSSDHDGAGECARLDRMFRDKARAEIASAEQVDGSVPLIRAHGDELAEILLVKGEPGPGDHAAGYALAGDDGDAANKALDALGLASARFAFCTRAADVDLDARAARIRALVEAVDPSIVLALDPLAAHDFAQACGCAPLAAGKLSVWRGRTVLAIDGLEASLADERLKRRVWGQLKSLAVADHPET